MDSVLVQVIIQPVTGGVVSSSFYRPDTRDPGKGRDELLESQDGRAAPNVRAPTHPAFCE